MSEERNDWIVELERKKQNLYVELVQGPSFQAEFPASLTAAQFVDGLGVRLGKALRSEEHARLVNALQAGGATRATVLREVIEGQR